MARRLKINLEIPKDPDGKEKEYTLKSLSVLQVTAVRKKTMAFQKGDPSFVRYGELLKKEKGKDELPVAEMDELLTLEEGVEEVHMSDAFGILVMSLAKTHKEFKADFKNEDDLREKKEMVMEMMDLNEMKFLSEFAMTGTVPEEVDAVFDGKDIVVK